MSGKLPFKTVDSILIHVLQFGHHIGPSRTALCLQSLTALNIGLVDAPDCRSHGATVQ